MQGAHFFPASGLILMGCLCQCFLDQDAWRALVKHVCPGWQASGLFQSEIQSVSCDISLRDD